MLVFIALMYFVMIAPNQKKQKKWQQMLGQLKNGDRVTTNGGIRGSLSRQRPMWCNCAFLRITSSSSL